jgi:acyl-CoA synthetase (AMP-forming)/AMP-acid ligase II
MNITELTQSGAAGAVAIRARGRMPLGFGRLREQVADTAHLLGRLGVHRGDAVALALRNGPEAAVAFLGVAGAAAAAPLNPACRESEVAFYLEDLHARLLVVDQEAGGAAAAARACGVPVLVLAPQSDSPAGCFTLTLPAGEPRSATLPEGRYAEGVALLLHTSGTTARPKLVGLTDENLWLSARNIAATLGLGPGDTCLNVMPLFHVHGLVGGVLASLAAGACAWCARGFNALAFFDSLSESGATWYTAVPSMHQAILARSRGQRKVLEARRLRFVRSSSAPLPEAVWDQLEQVFRAPVVSAYGMTEAAHQIACTPLPPGIRKRGTVGAAAGPEIATVSEDGHPVPAGTPGEVVLRGPTIIRAYLRSAEANLTAFRDGWLRTGDEGVLDEDGHLRLSGRLKLMINCGGEKISPYEIEDVLLRHPAVAQAVSFGVPQPMLGEMVGAAVVLRDGQAVDERTLKAFAAERLVGFKVPRRILVLDELPKGPTGKLQRVGVAATFGLT